MGKKNIKPLLPQPVIRTNAVKPALLRLREESLTTGPFCSPIGDEKGINPDIYIGDVPCLELCSCRCSFDGEED
ncbi:DUF5837 family cyanobactin class RiPP [Okeania sp. SIO3I5]|uniref:DUF5837 family cyanobactin class RiPP n=1 Tax=Okeania sp. SIO3I5 TaxID=2607805 RepID=UPI00344ADDEC